MTWKNLTAFNNWLLEQWRLSLGYSTPSISLGCSDLKVKGTSLILHPEAREIKQRELIFSLQEEGINFEEVPRSKNKLGSELGGFKFQPSVADFKIVRGQQNYLLDNLFGIKLRNKEGHTDRLDIYNGGAESYYLEYPGTPKLMRKYQIRTLSRMKKLSEKGERLQSYNLFERSIRSVSFFILGLNQVFPTWYKDKSPQELDKLWKMYSAIASNLRNSEMKIRRVYIPKANGKVRGLGVQSPAWRIITSLQARYIVMCYGHLLPKSNHAYQPTKGTLSCMRETLRNVDKANIWETDLRAFFPSLWLN